MSDLVELAIKMARHGERPREFMIRISYEAACAMAHRDAAEEALDRGGYGTPIDEEYRAKRQVEWERYFGLERT